MAKNYAKGWFIVDLGSTLPIAYVLYVLDPDTLPWRAVELSGEAGGPSSSLKVLKILRLFRLAKMLRMAKLKSLMEKYLLWGMYMQSESFNLPLFFGPSLTDSFLGVGTRITRS